MLDILIAGGLVIDGTGAAARKADLGIIGDRIVFPVDSSLVEAKFRINASGLATAPGFIDIHSHADFTLPILPTADSKIHQGFTLEVVGNCGSSPAPLNAKTRQEMIANTSDGGTNMAWAGMGWEWSSFGEYLQQLEANGVSINVAALVGHGAIRRMVMGNRATPPDPGQMKQMTAELCRAMDEGAIGFSTGLTYPPGSITAKDEIIELARAAAGKNGLFTSHIRGEGDTLLDAIAEAIDIGRRSGISVQISHLKALGRANWDRLEEAIQLIQDAIDEGLAISADKYPYDAMNTNIGSLMPAWSQTGGVEAFLEMVADRATRARIRANLRAPGVSGEVDWQTILVSYCPKFPEYEGLAFDAIASLRGQAVEDAVLDIACQARGQVELIAKLISPETLALGLGVPWVMIGTDGEGRSTTGMFARGKPHPRNFGTAAKWLGGYVREMKLLSLPEAVHRMTGLPASKLKLDRRGLIKEGYFADLTIFDPLTIQDLATYENPQRYPRGIEWVIVNGQVVISEGVHTGQRPGIIIRNR